MQRMLRGYGAPVLAAMVLAQLCNMADVRGDGTRPIATVMESLIGPEVLSDNLIVVRRVAEELDADARFDYLADWVLSSADHTDVRLIGWFPPATPKPGSLLANADDRLAFDLPVSPAIDLLNAAVESRTDVVAGDNSCCVRDSARSTAGRIR